MNRATGSTTEGRPVLHSTSTPVAVASIGTRGRGIHSSARHAPTAQASAAHAAGLSTVARPQPSRASRSVVAAATGSSASASSTSAGEYHRLRRATGGPGCGDGGAGSAAGSPPGGATGSPGMTIGRRLGVPGGDPAPSCDPPGSGLANTAVSASGRFRGCGRRFRRGRRCTGTGTRTTGGMFPRVPGSRRRHCCSSGRVRLQVGNGTSTATQHATWTSV